MNKEYYTVKEYAARYGIHINTVYRQIKKGSIKTERVGKQWFIKKEG